MVEAADPQTPDGLAAPTRALAGFVHDLTLSDVPPDVQARAKDLFLDAMACALAGEASEEMAAVGALSRLFGDAPTATVIGASERIPPGAAALQNAYRITALTACDVYTPAHMHVTPEVVPAALAAAEVGGASGAEFLLALIAGLEVAVRVGASLDYPTLRTRGWHTPGIAGTFGAAAAAARLQELDSQAIAYAFGLAGSQAAGTWAAWGTPTVKFHQARAALAGLMAARLAATGFTASDQILTAPDGGILPTYAGGGDPAAALRDLGSHWELMEISLRPWPGATPLQPVITAIARLLERGPIPAASIRSVRVAVAPSVKREHAAFRHPGGTFQAMLSVDYATAAFLYFGRLGFAEYLAPTYSSPELADFIERRVEVVGDPALDRLGCSLSIETEGGETLQMSVDAPEGHPGRPASHALVAAKFAGAAEGPLGGATAAEVLRDVEMLEGLATVGHLCGRLRPAPTPASEKEHQT
jgi:2-methylcitrate dehydratase PrpD